MHVVATAGHVDHGKSTLVRALTGMEPDRWAEERRRGMTIDLGYAWMPLAGDELSFVDVPGHERFIGNMLAGLGPAPAVMFVVAADEGWRQQSDDHLAAIDALGLTHGLLVVTRSDRADPAEALMQARARLAATSLAGIDAVAVSPVSGTGMDGLRTALGDLVARLPAPILTGPVRLWIDRAFTVVGAGTVVTGTLGAGRLEVGGDIELNGVRHRIRGLQQSGRPVQRADAVSRVALNLSGLTRDHVRRGDVLTTGAWSLSQTVDVALTADGRLPSELTFHLGTAAVPAQARPLSDRTARLRLGRALTLSVGDRGILRDPGAHRIVGGAVVLTLEPEPFLRRGAARRRGEELSVGITAVGELERRGRLRRQELMAMGLDPDRAGGRVAGDWVVSPVQWERWRGDLLAALDAHAAAHPLDPGLTGEAVRYAIGLPDPSLLNALVADTDVVTTAGRLLRPGVAPALGPAEIRLRPIEEKLREQPFAAPERDELTLDQRELKVAETTGRLLRLSDGIYLLPTAPELALDILRSLPDGFTVSEARQALGTTRRVALPLLEHLDAQGWTERVDAGHRRLRH